MSAPGHGRGARIRVATIALALAVACGREAPAEPGRVDDRWPDPERSVVEEDPRLPCPPLTRQGGTGRKQGGIVRLQCEDPAGASDGAARSWWPDGALRTDERFAHGVPDGLACRWETDGTAASPCSFRVAAFRMRDHVLTVAWRHLAPDLVDMAWDDGLEDEAERRQAADMFGEVILLPRGIEWQEDWTVP